MNHEVLVTLDSLLDTRYPVLFDTLKDDEGLDVSKYTGRQSDDNITTGDFKTAYKNRTTDHLRRSTMTSIPMLIAELRERVLKGGRLEIINLTINVAPYNLSNAELTELCGIIKLSTGVDSVATTYISNELLTPTAISRWDCVIMYDFIDWLVMHSAEVAAASIADKAFYYPQLRNVTDVNVDIAGNKVDAQIEKHLSDIDIFSGLEMFLGNVVQLTSVPVKMWCSVEL